MNQIRLNNIQKRLKEQKVPQMLISDPASIFYLTGRWIDPGERLFALYINVDGNHKIFINQLFTVPEDLGVEKVWFSDTEDSIQIVKQYTDPTQPLGIDKNLAARFLLRLMELGAGSSYINTSICVDQTRACKDREEQEAMRTASRLNDLGIEEFRKNLYIGITELEVAAKMEVIYKKLGADGLSFQPLVGFGANAAIGHHEPDETKLKAGDCVLLDVGCKKDNYCADMTRTFFFQSVTKEHEKIYDLVKRANEAAEALIKPGVRFCDIDKTARQVIEEAGYGDKFTHRLGHSIGIEVHEYGDVSSSNTDTVQPGMSFSIEPGIYLSDEVGVRIEDLVLVTETGYEVLNSFSKELEILA